MASSPVFPRIRAEVLRLASLIPAGKFTTYGSIAVHMNCNPRHVARALAGLTDQEAAGIPWHRVIAADARISRSMAPELAALQQALLEAEGISVDDKGRILGPDDHFHPVGVRRDIRWKDVP